MPAQSARAVRSHRGSGENTRVGLGRGSNQWLSSVVAAALTETHVSDYSRELCRSRPACGRWWGHACLSVKIAETPRASGKPARARPTGRTRRTPSTLSAGDHGCATSEHPANGPAGLGLRRSRTQLRQSPPLVVQLLRLAESQVGNTPRARSCKSK